MLTSEIKINSEISYIRYNRELLNLIEKWAIFKYNSELYFLYKPSLKKIGFLFKDKAPVDELAALIKNDKLIIKSKVEKYSKMMIEKEWDWSKDIIAVFKCFNTIRLTDGAHRILAAKKAGIKFLYYKDFTEICISVIKNSDFTYNGLKIKGFKKPINLS